MKRLFQFFLFATVIATGITAYLGASYENILIERLGIGLLFGGIYLNLVVAVLVAGVKYYRAADAKDNPHEFDMTDSFSVSLYLFGGSLFGKKLSPKKRVVLGMVVMLLLLSALFGGFACLFFQQFVIGTVCLTIFGLATFVFTFGAVIKFLFHSVIPNAQTPATNTETNGKNAYRVGVVKECLLSPNSQDCPEENRRYIITLEIEGKEYTAMQQTRFEAGARVAAETRGGLAIINLPATQELNKNTEEQSL